MLARLRVTVLVLVLGAEMVRFKSFEVLYPFRFRVAGPSQADNRLLSRAERGYPFNSTLKLILKP